jgi:hypothetical protein
MNKNMQVSKKDFVMGLQEDDDPDLSCLEEEGEEERKTAFEAGEWVYVGIYAEVWVWVPLKDGTRVRQHLQTPGVWGIEDDAGEDFFQEIFADQCDVLAEIIEQLGGEVTEETEGATEK